MSRVFVCRCEDVDLHEIHEAIAEGYTDLESLRRFTALGTGPCQGKACLNECIRILAQHRGIPEAHIGLMTLRPPVVPVPLGHLAALDDETVINLLDDAHAADERRLRAALADDKQVRTGRPGPTDRKKTGGQA